MKDQIKVYILASKLAAVEILLYILLILMVLAELNILFILTTIVAIYVIWQRAVGKKEIVHDLFK